MATSTGTIDKILKCTLCMEVFNSPCTLTCQHMFCSKCLISFTEKQPESIIAESFPCPVCSNPTKVPKPGKPMHEWFEDTKTSFFLQRLLDCFGPGTKSLKYCSECKLNWKVIPASLWCTDCNGALCEKCARRHKVIRSSKLHAVICLSEEFQVRKGDTGTCTEHSGEKKELFCKDCKKTVCPKCCTVYHGKCESIVTLQSEIPSMKTEITKSREVLINKHDDLRSSVQETKCKKPQVMKMYHQTENEIRFEGQNAMDAISRKENKLLGELKDATDRQLQTLADDIAVCEMTVQIFERKLESTDQAVKADNEKDMYEMHQCIASGALESVGTGTDQDKKKIIKIKFRNYPKKLTKALNDLKLGELEVLCESGKDMKATVKLQATRDVKVAGDENQCLPTDMTVLNVKGIETLVVVDHFNGIKSFYLRNGQSCHNVLHHVGNPWALTKVEDNKIAVTFPNNWRINMVEVNPQLKLISTISTEKKYWGITVLTPLTVAVSSQSPPSVDILDMSGTVIRSLTLGITKDILSTPGYLITTRNGNIIISDQDTKSILCLTPPGDIVFFYSPTGSTALESPHGITVTDTGDILVADLCEGVIHITESGQFVRKMVTEEDGVLNPHGLCVDKQGQLYVGVCSYGECAIKVYAYDCEG